MSTGDYFHMPQKRLRKIRRRALRKRISMFLFFCVALPLLVYGGIRQIVRMQHTSNRHACTQWGIAAHRETKFVYTSGGTYRCFTPATDDTWIPTNQIRFNGDINVK